MNMMQMRNYISEHPRYRKSPAWKDRCMRMPESQVVAIYNKFRKEDYRKIEREMKRTEKTNQKFHQIDIFEYLEELRDEEDV